MSEDPIRVSEVTIDPRWRVGRLVVGNLPFLRFEHPRHGIVDVVLSEKSLADLHMALGQLVSPPGPPRALQ